MAEVTLNFLKKEKNPKKEVTLNFLNEPNLSPGEEQKNETRHEMRTTYDLAAAQERRMFEKQNLTLQKILIWVGVLAIGDFLYNWLITDNHQFLSKHEQGAIVAVALVMVAALFTWIIERKA